TFAPRVWTPRIATPPRSGMGGGGRLRNQAQRRGVARRRASQSSVSTAMMRITPKQAGGAPGGECGAPATCAVSPPPRSMVAGGGNPTAKDVEEGPEEDGPKTGPRAPPGPAKEARPADDHR